jgi:hypothetical protein
VVRAPLTVVLLPGLDGSGLLFEQLVERTPPDFRAQVITYPGDEVLGYDQLEPLVRAKRCADEVIALRPDATIAELDAGHPLLQLKPDAAWREIAAFVASLPGVRDGGGDGA